LPDRVVLADAGYGDGTEFREELEKRLLNYAVGVSPQLGVWLKPPKLTTLPAKGRGRATGRSPLWQSATTTVQAAAQQGQRLEEDSLA